MTTETFGGAVGKLIHQRRRAQGLTQTQLAEDAFGSAAKTRRISELEGGLVANPHPKTLDPLIVALGITNEELEECAARTSARPDPDLDRAYREAKNLIEAIARQFEHSNPDSSLAELEDYLRAKAKEWVELRERWQRLDETDASLVSLRAKAIDALDNGDFQGADAAFAEAEKLQTEGALSKEVQRLVELRIARADIKLIEGESEEALKHYLSAVDVVQALSQSDAVTLLNELAYRLYDGGQRSLKPHFDVGAGLLERCLTIPIVVEDPRQVATISYRLCLMYRNATASSDRGGADYVEKAIEYGRSALSHWNSVSSNVDEDVFAHRSAEIALGNALFDKARFSQSTGAVDDAVKMFKASRSTLSNSPRLPKLEAHVCNSLGSALLTRLEMRKSSATATELDEVIASYEQAISAAQECGDLEVWGVASGNLGATLGRRANVVENNQQAKFQRIRGISLLLAATETYPEVEFPLPYAQTHLRLGTALFQHGLRCEPELMELYLLRAIASFEIASSIFDEARYTSEWASIQSEISHVFFVHAGTAEDEVAISDLDRAAHFLENAMRGHKALGALDAVAACRKAMKAVVAEKARRKAA